MPSSWPSQNAATLSISGKGNGFRSHPTPCPHQKLPLTCWLSLMVCPAFIATLHVCHHGEVAASLGQPMPVATSRISPANTGLGLQGGETCLSRGKDSVVRGEPGSSHSLWAGAGHGSLHHSTGAHCPSQPAVPHQDGLMSDAGLFSRTQPQERKKQCQR